MAMWSPTRRELIATIPLAASAAAFGGKVAAAPASDPLRFFVIGDWGRRGGAYQRDVADRMAELASGFRPRFILSTGDNFYTFGLSSPRDSHWQQSFEAIYSPDALGMPWYPVLGNHDWGGDVDAQLERTRSDPDGRWQFPALWYQVDTARLGHPDIAIFMIDTVVWNGVEDWLYEMTGASIPPGFHERQRKWLEQALQVDVPMKIVVGHHAIYSVGAHGGKKERGDLDAIMRDAGVTAFINGHDHCLYHIRADGMDYICSGGGSEELKTYKGGSGKGCVIKGDCPDPANPGTKPIWYSFQPLAGFASFEVDRHAMHMQLHGRRGGTPLWEQVIPARTRGQ